MDKLEKYRTKFFQIYANLPLGSRGEIVAVILGEPVSWKVAKLEIDQSTKKAEEILDQLIKLKILTTDE